MPHRAPWELTRAEAQTNPPPGVSYVPSLGGDRIARHDPDGTTVLTDLFFDHSPADRKLIWEHEQAHSVVGPDEQAANALALKRTAEIQWDWQGSPHGPQVILYVGNGRFTVNHHLRGVARRHEWDVSYWPIGAGTLSWPPDLQGFHSEEDAKRATEAFVQARFEQLAEPPDSRPSETTPEDYLTTDLPPAPPKTAAGDYTSDYTESDPPYGEENIPYSYPAEEGHTPLTDLDTGNAVDWADAGEMSEQGLDPQRRTNVGPEPMRPPAADRGITVARHTVSKMALLCEVCDSPITKSACGQATICSGCHTGGCEFCSASDDYSEDNMKQARQEEDYDKKTDISAGADIDLTDGSYPSKASPETKKLTDQDLIQTPADAKIPAGTRSQKTALEARAFEGEWKPKPGDTVRYMPSGQTGTVIAMNDRFAEVEFPDGQAPTSRQVSINQLGQIAEAAEEKKDDKPAEPKDIPDKHEAGPSGPEAQTTGAPQVMILLQSALAKAQHEQRFLARLDQEPKHAVLADLRRERRGDMAELAHHLKLAGTTPEAVLLTKGWATLLANSEVDGESLLDSLKFIRADLWEKTAAPPGGSSSPVRDSTTLPEPVIRQTLRELEEKEQKGALSTTEEAEYGQLLNEEQRRTTNVDPRKNHVKTYALEKGAVGIGDPSGGEEQQAGGAQLTEWYDRLGDPLHVGDTVTERNGFDYGKVVGGPDADSIEVELPDGSRQVWTANQTYWGKNDKTASLSDAFVAAIADAEVPDLAARIAYHKPTLSQIYRTGVSDGWTEAETGACFARQLGLVAADPEVLHRQVTAALTDGIDHLTIGTGPAGPFAKEAGGYGELPADLFSDTDYTQAERHLGATALENLEDERRRLLASPSNLINAAANTFRGGVKKLRGQYTLEHVSLNKISQRTVGDDGRMVDGALTFHVILAAHQFRRRTGVDLVVEVVDGEPQDIAYFVTANGEKLPFNKENLDRRMNVRRDALRPQQRSTRVQRSHIEE